MKINKYKLIILIQLLFTLIVSNIIELYILNNNSINNRQLTSDRYYFINPRTYIIEGHLVIENHTIINESIIVRKNGILEIKGILTLNATDNFNINITIKDNASLILNNGILNSTNKTNIYLTDNSSLFCENKSLLNIFSVITNTSNNILINCSNVTNFFNGSCNDFTIINSSLNIVNHETELLNFSLNSMNITFYNASIVMIGNNCHVLFKSTNFIMNNSILWCNISKLIQSGLNGEGISNIKLISEKICYIVDSKIINIAGNYTIRNIIYGNLSFISKNITFKNSIIINSLYTLDFPDNYTLINTNFLINTTFLANNLTLISLPGKLCLSEFNNIFLI